MCKFTPNTFIEEKSSRHHAKKPVILDLRSLLESFHFHVLLKNVSCTHKVLIRSFHIIPSVYPLLQRRASANLEAETERADPSKSKLIHILQIGSTRIVKIAPNVYLYRTLS